MDAQNYKFITDVDTGFTPDIQRQLLGLLAAVIFDMHSFIIPASGTVRTAAKFYS